MLTKKCKRCRKVKPLAEFRPDPDYRDGHRKECKACRRNIDEQYRINNADLVRARHARYRLKLRERADGAD